MNVQSLINSRRVKIHYHLDRKNARRMPPITAISKKQVKSVQKKITFVSSIIMQHFTNYTFWNCRLRKVFVQSTPNQSKRSSTKLISNDASDIFFDTEFSLHSHNLKKHRKRMSFQQRLKCHRDQMLKIQKLHSNMYATEEQHLVVGTS